MTRLDALKVLLGIETREQQECREAMDDCGMRRGNRRKAQRRNCVIRFPLYVDPNDPGVVRDHNGITIFTDTTRPDFAAEIVKKINAATTDGITGFMPIEPWIPNTGLAAIHAAIDDVLRRVQHLERKRHPVTHWKVVRGPKAPALGPVEFTIESLDGDPADTATACEIALQKLGYRVEQVHPVDAENHVR